MTLGQHLPRRILWAALLVLVALALPLGARAQQEPPTLDQYLALLRQASAAAQRSDRLALEEIAAQLEATGQVRLPDGTLAKADNRWLSQAIQPADPDFDTIAEQVGAIINAITLPQSAAPADAMARLRAILEKPPFAEAQRGRSWVDQLLDWLGQLLDRLLRSGGGSASYGGDMAGRVIVAIGVIILVAVVIYLLLYLRRQIVRETAAKDADPESNLTARTAMDQASSMARGGDHRTAMRYLYLSALLWLDERSLLRYDRALTNREYLDRASANPALRGRLAPIVETFDKVWYGHTPLDDSDFAAYKQQIEALRSELS